MLNLNHVTLRHQNGDVLIEDLNIQIHENDKIGIIGEEGNGKSTLIKAIANPLWIEEYADIEGQIIKDSNLKIGYFSQALEAKWEASYIDEYLLLKEPGDVINQAQYNELQVYMQEATKLHLASELIARNQLMKYASGGEKVKLRMLKMIHEHPDILLLDEPTNDLDLDTLTWLEEFINNWDKPILFISHDDVLLARCANRIVHIEQRNHRTKAVVTVSNVTYEEYVASRGRSIAKERQLATKEKAEYQKKMVKLNDMRNAVHDALNDTVRSPFYAACLARRMANLKAIENRFEETGYRHVDTMEEAIDVYFENKPLPSSKIIYKQSFDNITIAERLLIRNVELDIRGQDKVAFIGPNGCGKTVLMTHIYEALKDRIDIRLGYMPQDYMSVLNNFETPVAYLLSTGDKADVTRARDLLGRMKFRGEDMLRPCHDLSEGQKAKLCLLKFIKEDCNVLLLDEPTRNLSPLSAPVIRHILKQFSGCIISISHDRSYLQTCVTTIYEIKDQNLILVNDIL